MTRNRRTKILVQGDPALRARMAAEVSEKCKTQIIEGPAKVLVMLTVRETARNSLFHPGEVMASEMKVQVNGIDGLGIIAGNRDNEAGELALIDGAWNAGCSFIPSWIPLLEIEEKKIAVRRDRANASVMRTQVSFQTMNTGAES
jgi:alpha-D-ribose 1-methylphosphonate 5-triphosphate synthase subunit PhnG